ncbi:Uncharacterized protein CLAVI_000188 [Candidatus Clavichlamydia salmonicola]|uniref:SycD/LcrH family type III secretion system chaperone n=1 Tax=Candidatus Clavichlamydia salmonicola TaxID=469812 RepID=UPI001891036E|nr:SycD/LcrH family type III secretion system chaperone [Candidatus Clavichlamydia salmonicola]MBF5050577.1 Uncharacterized protein [Candidatus Clavichlamydia salmonicola]
MPFQPTSQPSNSKKNTRVQQATSSSQKSSKQNKSKLDEIAAFHKSKEERAAESGTFTQAEAKQALTNVLIRLKRGENLQNILGLSNDLIEQIYALAYGFYIQGKYQEALSLFQTLVSAKPASYKFNLGLGSCYLQLGHYEQAAFSFFLAFSEQTDNPIPAYYIADSFFRGDFIEEAKEFIDITINLCGKKPSYSSIKEQTLFMKNAINSTDGKKKTPSKKAAKQTEKVVAPEANVKKTEGTTKKKKIIR